MQIDIFADYVPFKKSAEQPHEMGGNNHSRSVNQSMGIYNCFSRIKLDVKT